MVQEVFGLCAVPSGDRNEPLKTRKVEKGKAPDRIAKGWKVEGVWHKKDHGTSPKRGCWRTGERCPGRKAVSQKIQIHA